MENEIEDRINQRNKDRAILIDIDHVCGATLSGGRNYDVAISDIRRVVNADFRVGVEAMQLDAEARYNDFDEMTAFTEKVLLNKILSMIDGGE